MFKVLNEKCTPIKGSKYSACVDLFASKDVVIYAGETKLVTLGVKIDSKFLYKYLSRDSVQFTDEEYHMGVSEKYGYLYSNNELHEFINSHYLQLMPRSSLAIKTGLIIANGVGIIDLDYEDEICIALHLPMDIVSVNSMCDNSNPCFSEIKEGDKIAQITLLEHKAFLFGIESDEKRVGGFGSTDKEVIHG